MKNILRKIQKCMHDERGATMVEYALMVAFVAIVAVASVALIGGNVTGAFTAIAGAI